MSESFSPTGRPHARGCRSAVENVDRGWAKSTRWASARCGRLVPNGRVAKTWQESRRRPTATNAANHVSAGQPHNAVSDHQQPLSVSGFPWYY